MRHSHEIFIWARAGLLGAVILTSACFGSYVLAQNTPPTAWPVFWRPFDTTKPPSTKGYRVLNFAVDVTHPPFGYKDATGRVTGFSVELARAICQENGFTCRFEAVPWDDIPTHLLDGRAEMAIASISMTRAMRERLAFSNRYFLNPARFVVLKTSSLNKSDPPSLADQNIAVIDGTAHLAFLKKYYPEADIKPYGKREDALRDLQLAQVDAFFSDGVSLLYWMQSEKAHQCCRFIPGYYIESDFFGEGIGFSVAKKNSRLAKIFNFGLEKIRKSGTLVRLYQIHFPGPLY